MFLPELRSNVFFWEIPAWLPARTQANSGMRYCYHLPDCCPWRVSARASVLQRTRLASRQPGPLFFLKKREVRGCGPTLRQAYSRPEPRVQFAFKDSMIHIICNSHYVSHFAAFFIDTGAKISVVESCLRLVGGSHMESAPIASGWLVSGSFGWVWASRVMGKGEFPRPARLTLRLSSDH